MIYYKSRHVHRLRLMPLFCLLLTQSVAQITITYPVSRMVVQRNNANQATVQISGSYARPLDVVEARVVARAAGQGVSTDWATLQANPVRGQFSGTLSVSGGWYRVEVRGRNRGRVVAEDSVGRFGVGEVFAIMGHSNAQGSGCTINGVEECPTRPGATDDRVTVIALDQESPDFQRYLQTADPRYLPGLAFSQLKTFSGMAPFAKMAWLWGQMGDVLVQRINVPVLLYNAGFGGSNMEQTYNAAYDIPFSHGFINYNLRMPYVNVRNLMNLYVPTTGLRAILLHHGGNDRENPSDLILKHYYGVIDKVRQEFNKPELACIIALSSFSGRPFENVRSAQVEVINRVGYHTFPGPDLDSITALTDRPDGIHYSPAGQAKAGERWANAITETMLQDITPYEAQQQPLIRLNCGSNGQLRLTLPPGSAYEWNTGSTEQSLTVGTGTYQARLHTTGQEIRFPPAVRITNSPSLNPTERASVGIASQAYLPNTSNTFQVHNAVYGCETTLSNSN